MSSQLKDIAAKAGVTTGTVSRALSGKVGVSEKKREAILKIADEMDYVPNFQASSLRTGKSVGMTIITSQYSYNSIGTLKNYILLQKAIKEFGAANIQMKSGSMSAAQAVQTALAQKCRFLVINGIKLDQKTINLLKNSAAHVVLMECASEEFDSVEIYRENGMFQAARLLLLGGCKNILFYNDSSFEDPNDRLRSIIAAYKSLKQPLSSINLFPFQRFNSITKDGFNIGYQATLEALRTKAVDALFCSNDEMAIGALKAVKENGLRVPEDVKVVGFDDIPEAKFAASPLTTVGQPAQEMTDAVIELCKKSLDDPGRKIASLIYSTNLIVRESAPMPDKKLREEVFMKLN